ncbi:YeeE/YedE family protein [Thalassotalea sp. LPB0316]|uniref:YeeE/YedE family protein n=1 Tax=Thalassotalea sp. LPB0316 TaxID=2769490 RepID=UPI0018672CDB|nr:YeeE/YedE family protein [Thalassotalea sp. LPB0316]QOL24906.1 YeeE/YedE family protein [Thalassotalea sp. LPB0316]
MAFDFVDALVGGIMLGISATVLMLFNGKTAGISGIVSGLIPPRVGDILWRVLFVLGMAIGGVIGATFHHIDTPEMYSENTYVVLLAGLLVGIGTKLANGCTSGHGIVGIGRLSKRSMVATGIFMLSAIITYNLLYVI